MSAFLVLVGATLGSAIGWWAGAKIGLMTAYFLSVIGTAGGVYAVRRWLSNYRP